MYVEIKITYVNNKEPDSFIKDVERITCMDIVYLTSKHKSEYMYGIEFLGDEIDIDKFIESIFHALFYNKELIEKYNDSVIFNLTYITAKEDEPFKFLTPFHKDRLLYAQTLCNTLSIKRQAIVNNVFRESINENTKKQMDLIEMLHTSGSFNVLTFFDAIKQSLNENDIEVPYEIYKKH